MLLTAWEHRTAGLTRVEVRGYSPRHGAKVGWPGGSMPCTFGQLLYFFSGSVLLLQLLSAMVSDIGRVRCSNQDSVAMLPENGAFVVCDGMGGAAGGEEIGRAHV